MTVRLVIIILLIVLLSKEYVGKNFRLQSRLQNAGLDCILGKCYSEFGMVTIAEFVFFAHLHARCNRHLLDFFGYLKTNCYCYVAISAVFHVNCRSITAILKIVFLFGFWP
jgi:hypothetical protein